MRQYLPQIKLFLHGLDILNSEVGINYKAVGLNESINKVSVQAKVQSAMGLLGEAINLIEKEYKE